MQTWSSSPAIIRKGIEFPLGTAERTAEHHGRQITALGGSHQERCSVCYRSASFPGSLLLCLSASSCRRSQCIPRTTSCTCAAPSQCFPAERSTDTQVLIHNAAGGAASFKLTVDGLESQFATDHFGPFLLTKLLAPKLLAVRTTSYVPRVVFVASAAHAMGPGVDFATLRRPDPAAKYNTLVVYHQVKWANVTTAIELSRRAHEKLNAYSLHPGSKRVFL